jgi:DNA-damage-inducible protein J
MAKTIQVRVDDKLKDSADSLFISLGMDTSTAIRMFLVAALDTGGIPFAVTHNADRDTAIQEAIDRRKNGGHFYSADEFLAHLKAAIAEGVNDNQP